MAEEKKDDPPDGLADPELEWEGGRLVGEATLPGLRGDSLVFDLRGEPTGEAVVLEETPPKPSAAEFFGGHRETLRGMGGVSLRATTPADGVALFSGDGVVHNLVSPPGGQRLPVEPPPAPAEERPSTRPAPPLPMRASSDRWSSLPPPPGPPLPARQEPEPNRVAVTAGGLPPAMPPVKKMDPRLIETVEAPAVAVEATVIVAEEPVRRFPPPPNSVPPPAAGGSSRRMSGPPSRPPRTPNRYVAIAIIVGLVLCIAIVVIGMQTRAAIQGDDVSGPAKVIASIIRRSQRHTPPAPTPTVAPVRRASPPVVVQRPAPRLRPAPTPRVAPAPQPPTVVAPSAAPQCRTLGSFSTNVASAQQQALRAGYAVTYLFPGEHPAAHTIVCRRE